MSTLSDQEVVKIAKGVAAANNVSVDQVLTAPAWDSTGASAIEIKYVLTPGEYRILADYEPSRDFTVDETKVAISDAREAIAWFQASAEEQQKAFLTMLLFRQR